MIREILFTCFFFAGLIFIDRYPALVISMIICSLFSYYGTKIVIGNWHKISSVYIRISDARPLDGIDTNSYLNTNGMNHDDLQCHLAEETSASLSLALLSKHELTQESAAKITDQNGRTFNCSHCGIVLSHEEEIRTFIRKIFHHYIWPWYKNISQNEDACEELNSVLADILITAYNNVSRMCILDIIEKLICLYSQHFHHYLQALDNIRQHRGQASIKACFGMETEIESAYKISHPALADETTEWCYLRGITATIIDLFWPQEFLGCHAAYVMLEEILSKNVLFPLVNLFSDPDWLNQMVILLMSDTPVLTQKFYDNKHSEENVCNGKISSSKNSEKSKTISTTAVVSKDYEHNVLVRPRSHSLENSINYTNMWRHSDCEPKLCQKRLRLSLNVKCQPSITDIFVDFQAMLQRFDTGYSSCEQENTGSDWEIWNNEVPSKKKKLEVSYYYSNLSKMKSQSSHDIDNISMVKNEYQDGEKKESQESNLKKCWSVDCLSEINPLSHLLAVHTTNPNLFSTKSTSSKMGVADMTFSKKENIGIDVEEAQEATEVAWLDLFNDVQIVETEIREEIGKGTYLLYCIQYSALFLNKEEESHTQFVRNNILVKRRFREFLALQSRLEDNPKLKKYMKKIKPPNKSIGSLFSPLDKKIVEDRKQFLENYLQRLCSCKVIAASSELQEFLAYGGDASIAYVRKINDIGVPRIDKMLLKGVRGAIDLIKTALPNLPPDDNEKNLPTISTKGIQSKSSFLPAFGKSKHDNHQHPIEVKYIGYNDSHLTQRLSDYIENFDMNSSEGSMDARNDVHHRKTHLFERTDSASSVDESLIFQHEKREEAIADEENLEQLFKVDMPLANAILDLYLKSVKIFLPLLGNSVVTTVLKALLGYYFNKWLTNRIHNLFSYEKCVTYLHILHLSLWPEGEAASCQIEKRDVIEDSKHHRDIAFVTLKLFLPGVLNKIIGREVFEDSVLLLHDSLQYSKLNRCLVYHILDQLMDHLCSEEGHHIS